MGSLIYILQLDMNSCFGNVAEHPGQPGLTGIKKPKLGTRHQNGWLELSLPTCTRYGKQTPLQTAQCFFVILVASFQHFLNYMCLSEIRREGRILPKVKPLCTSFLSGSGMVWPAELTSMPANQASVLAILFLAILIHCRQNQNEQGKGKKDRM